MDLVPAIVEDSLNFYKTLIKYAEQDVMFSLEEKAVKLTIEIIGGVVL